MATDGVDAKLAFHVCFGNRFGRSRFPRTYAPYFPGLLKARAHQFVLEFAGRELSELDVWKKYGADVDVKPFDTGTAAARAVLTGDIEIALAPTPLVISQISNVNANVVSIYGFPSPDWILATTDATKTSST